MLENKYLKLLSEELVVALGCTEPAVIALAAATARKYLKGKEIKKIRVSASGNVIKNAANVKIPGTDSTGINLAAAIGALKGKSGNKLEIFDKLDKTTFEQAKAMIASGKVTVDMAKSGEKLYIEVVMESSESVSKVVVEKTHTNVSLVEVDGKTITKRINDDVCEKTNFTSVESIWDFITQVDLDKLDIIRHAIQLNRVIGEEGLKNVYGLQTGRIILQKAESGIIPDSIISYAMALTSAACDARMAGAPLKVMSNSGSGNQGIVATVPVIAVWGKMGLPEEKLIRAAALSNLITIHIKHKFGRISALCGATLAAAGASCGITYLLGGGVSDIKSAIQNIAGNLTGMLCDGAKAGCALKVSTCASAAVLSALMSVDGISIASTDGIIEKNVEKTIDNISALGNEGVLEADKIMLSIILNKENKSISQA